MSKSIQWIDHKVILSKHRGKTSIYLDRVHYKTVLHMHISQPIGRVIIELGEANLIKVKIMPKYCTLVHTRVKETKNLTFIHVKFVYETSS